MGVSMHANNNNSRTLQWLAFILLMLGLVYSAKPASVDAKAPLPNIVLIMCDDMGFSDIGCYGGEVMTPNLDRLAAEGMRFTQFYNNAKCTTTRASIVTGLYPRFDKPHLRRNMVTLGEAMGVAAARLAPRPETRKILLVLTDGKAGCEGGGDAAAVHAREMTRRITKAGIELIGVGILDENIREVVADSIVIQKLEELPAQLCKLLGRTLKRGLRYVG